MAAQQPNPQRKRKRPQGQGTAGQPQKQPSKPHAKPGNKNRKSSQSAQPEVDLAIKCWAALLKCSPFHWIPPLRRFPGKLRALIWVGVAVLFYLVAPDTFSDVAWSLAGWGCLGLIALGVYAVVKAPKGKAAPRKRPREPWHPSGMSDKQWAEENDPRGDSTNPMQF